MAPHEGLAPTLAQQRDEIEPGGSPRPALRTPSAAETTGSPPGVVDRSRVAPGRQPLHPLDWVARVTVRRIGAFPVEALGDPEQARERSRGSWHP